DELAQLFVDLSGDLGGRTAGMRKRNRRTGFLSSYDQLTNPPDIDSKDLGNLGLSKFSLVDSLHHMFPKLHGMGFHHPRLP
ncbi:MAG: hypothetical protein KDA80_12205, partial [Planctomycetaceae bacterium]|nr:hypothetical protein [Planctomycetaceae bacterium]